MAAGQPRPPRWPLAPGAAAFLLTRAGRGGGHAAPSCPLLRPDRSHPALVHGTPARDKRAANEPSHSATGHHHAGRCTQVASLGPHPAWPRTCQPPCGARDSGGCLARSQWSGMDRARTGSPGPIPNLALRSPHTARRLDPVSLLASVPPSHNTLWPSAGRLHPVQQRSTRVRFRFGPVWNSRSWARTRPNLGGKYINLNGNAPKYLHSAGSI